MSKRNTSKSSSLLRAVLLPLALAGAMSQMPAYAQSNLRFLANTPAAALSKSDQKSLYESISKALDAGANGQSTEWRSAKERGPSARITPHFTDHKPPCAIVDLDITAKGVTQPMKMPYCQGDKGEWKLTNR